MRDERISCRPHPVCLFVFLACLAIGLAALLAPMLPDTRHPQSPPSQWGATLGVKLLLTVEFILPGAAGIFWALRSRIEADETGLRWRTWKQPWQKADWADVRDFYCRPPGGAARQYGLPHRQVVELLDGRQLTFFSDWTNHVRLRDQIAARARDARASE